MAYPLRIVQPRLHISLRTVLWYRAIAVVLLPVSVVLAQLAKIASALRSKWFSTKPVTVPSSPAQGSSLLRVVQGIDARTEFCVVGAPTDTLAIVIPGNPGFPQFYLDYMRTLHEESNGRIWCVSMGHLGHRRGLTGTSVFTLRDQINHKIKIVHALLELFPNTNIVLAGHSIGAHICCEVFRTLPSNRVTRIVGLCPTMHHIVTTPNGERLYPLMKIASIRKTIANFVEFIFALPRSLQEHIIAHVAAEVPSHMSSTLHDQIDGSVADNVLFMGRTEMEELLTCDAELMAEIGERLVLVFAHADGWVTDDHEADLQKLCPSAAVWKTQSTDNVKHAFVLGASELVARKTLEYVAPRTTP